MQTANLDKRNEQQAPMQLATSTCNHQTLTHFPIFCIRFEKQRQNKTTLFGTKACWATMESNVCITWMTPRRMSTHKCETSNLTQHTIRKSTLLTHCWPIETSHTTFLILCLPGGCIVRQIEIDTQKFKKWPPFLAMKIVLVCCWQSVFDKSCSIAEPKKRLVPTFEISMCHDKTMTTDYPLNNRGMLTICSIRTSKGIVLLKLELLQFDLHDCNLQLYELIVSLQMLEKTKRNVQSLCQLKRGYAHDSLLCDSQQSDVCDNADMRLVQFVDRTLFRFKSALESARIYLAQKTIHKWSQKRNQLSIKRIVSSSVWWLTRDHLGVGQNGSRDVLCLRGDCQSARETIYI